MLMDKAMIAKIKKIAEEMDLAWEYTYIGVRVQEQEFELGEIDHVSHIWDNNDDTGVELPGICACKLDCLGENDYFGDHIAIICGDEAEYGEDYGELIIRDPKVVAVIQ